MKYMMLKTAEQDALLSGLEGMAEYLEAIFGGLSPAEAVTARPEGAFSPVEHCWHLADLEREGFAVRIRRLLEETEPFLPDFDGAGLARARDYKSRSLVEGIRSFRAARLQNAAALRAIERGQWTRRGTQEGVGSVALCDLPAMMAEHDATHREEIEDWRRNRSRPG